LKNYLLKKRGEVVMMHHSPIMKCLGMATWLITALVSINMLTGMYDYNAIIWLGNRMPNLIIPLCWIIGLSGIISLVMYIKAIAYCGSSCGTCNCVGACNCK
jgi:hypothetical protein